MRTLIAIVNARSRREWRDAIRRTWLSQVPKDKANVVFFMGRGEPREFLADEVALDCSDQYEHLPEKIQAITRWTSERKYDFMLKCDDDVVLRPKALLNSGYWDHDFSGKANRPPQPYVVPMGFNYWLSSRSMGIISRAALPEDGSNDDEKWVSSKLWDEGIQLHHDPRYYLHMFQLTDNVNPGNRFRRALRPPSPAQIKIVEDNVSFSYCVHIAAEMNVKLDEFQKLFNKHGEV
jgi:hypothetical protein